MRACFYFISAQTQTSHEGKKERMKHGTTAENERNAFVISAVPVAAEISDPFRSTNAIGRK
jgi:hypothetical protein